MSKQNSRPLTLALSLVVAGILSAWVFKFCQDEAARRANLPGDPELPSTPEPSTGANDTTHAPRPEEGEGRMDPEAPGVDSTPAPQSQP